MKRLTVWLNEDEYKLFVKRAELKGLTPYGLHKKLILDVLKA